jgi:hypothetical protein
MAARNWSTVGAPTVTPIASRPDTVLCPPNRLNQHVLPHRAVLRVALALCHPATRNSRDTELTHTILPHETVGLGQAGSACLMRTAISFSTTSCGSGVSMSKCSAPDDFE